jgi:RNA recognition motif-containing protein
MNDATPNQAQPALDKAKIFVGGLSWQTTEETLRYHFEQYGEVVSVEVMRDRDTGNPRGFAFVVFQDDATVDLVMNNLPHEINHKIVDVKRAQARGAAPPSIHNKYGVSTHQQQQENEDPKQIQSPSLGTGSGPPPPGVVSSSKRDPTPEELQNKIFVGGLPVNVDNNSLKDFFTQFGNVTDAIVMMDAAQGRSRGFGFVTFENGTGGAQKALASQPLYIDNKYVEIKLAQPKGAQNNADHGKRNVLQNVGLRNASLSSSQSKGEFAGFAASYGRNGWKAGYGSYAFGKYGWAVQDWETFLDIPERSGFTFDLLVTASETSGRKKRDYHHANLANEGEISLGKRTKR